ncbi:CRISPR system Cascade subunit CasC [Endobacter medicaginis]|jgi:CRISPR system Cascade subunit CasC|uniref:CRISPR system Cascade subunit CasC n=1 Tax=Endobacter medicaginis TaxID=1181271 RepID=A0A850NJN8_9PROT|nr:type I-E CRISPR-associated protein Cas7/Cse4/CasC [Endobacter medicaginis]MBB3174816.1 CRISPR system Cascade subunit CasC [Endobacter medicaginis]MCX5476015.1 type I-E CRISPR-associated protein Cas7/Cse4/CasC [Endobacter medicaginis]NVN30051.1 type I-E CRISPR-associated protein Cas7/Cse4/CasC [Endobacter medicaginis]
MSRFLQLHLLTFFPPANLNRDDLGRPKTAIVGGMTRLRLSSQALKRAWRTSELFTTALDGHMGLRTQRLGEQVLDRLVAGGMPADKAVVTAREIAGGFGKPKDPKDKNPTQIEQLAFIAPEERDAAFALADRAIGGEKIDEKAVKEARESGLLRRVDTAADIALFGRMLASSPEYNREAAAQVAHAITTHAVTVEDDYYTAVDDLKTSANDAGAGFLGEAAFGSGVFYLYLCVDTALLLRNLGGDAETARIALAALIEAAATTAPRGKQNSFAAHGRAGYVLAERGDRQPRTLAGAFAQAVAQGEAGGDPMAASVARLRKFREQLDAAYGLEPEVSMQMCVAESGPATLPQIIAFGATA